MARRAASPRSRRTASPADELPVARVAVDVPLAHLDRPFDYLVPQRLAEAAAPGVRVRVRFAGQLTGGYLLERRAASDHPGRLAYLERVLSPEPVLTPEIAALSREVADRYGGTLADVLRLAIPPRHAGAEAQAPSGSRPEHPSPPPPAGPWARYTAGAAFLSALAAGRAPRAVWTALPGQQWPQEIARAVATAAGAGRGALVVVPDARDLGLIDAALVAELGPGRHVSLASGLGPAERYRRWLAILRGEVRVVAGARAAMFAPVRRLGLAVVWDDGDDLHAEPRAPYPHAREVLALRAHRAGAGALIGGFSRTAEGASLIASGWAASLAPARPVVRRFAPRVAAAGDDPELARDPQARSARMPGLALQAARNGLARGPVLVQVPRRGYVTAVACEGCRARALCPACGGTLALAAGEGPASCRWCGEAARDWRCPACGSARFRALVTGAGRTAEELGRAFPGTRVVTSSGSAALGEIPAAPALVVATPGAEPGAAGGYAAAVLLDGWSLLGRPSLRAAEEALRRWLNAAALVRPAQAGGTVVVVADPALPVVQALIRWDPMSYAERELAERAELRFPPAVRMAALTGPEAAVAAVLAGVRLPAGAEVLGPIVVEGRERRRAATLGRAGARSSDATVQSVRPGGEHGPGEDAGSQDEAGPGGEAGPEGEAGPGGEPGRAAGERADLVMEGVVRMLVRAPKSAGLELASELRGAQAARAARKEPGVVRVQLDPVAVI